MNRHLRHRPIKVSRPAGLAVEALEDRFAPAVFNVNSLADVLNPGNGVVTLRSAIQAANSTPGGNTINLTLPGTYQISLLGTAGEQDNAAGEFALTGTGDYTFNNTSGGAVVVNGGGLNRVFDINPAAETTTSFTVTFNGMTITGGNASPGDAAQGSGGGIRAQGAANVVLDNVVLTGNTATADGGAIAMESVTNNSQGTLTIMASTISFNHAGDAGGGIESDGAGLVTINTGTLIDFNTCVNQGAGIWLDTGGASMNITGAIISNNTAMTMLGGGIGNSGDGVINLTRSLIQNNFAGGSGGGFGDAANTGALHGLNCFFVNNTAVGDGGGIQEDTNTFTIDFCTFAGNVSQGADGGGGLFYNGSNGDVHSAVFQDNVAVNGAAIEDQAGNFDVTTSTFTNNHTLANNGGTGGNGGAIDAEKGSGELHVSNGVFVDNFASNGSTGNGGAIFQSTGDLDIKISIFSHNGTGGAGGAIDYSGGGVLTISQSTFNNNQAGTTGGALAISGGSTFLTNDTLAHNQAGGAGGGIFVSGSLMLLFDTINANTTGTNGGGISVATGPVTFEDTIVAGDTAPGVGPDVDSGSVSVTDNGANFIGTLSGATGFAHGTLTGNPNLGPLQDNGVDAFTIGLFHQKIPTEALLPGSPAIAAGMASVVTSLDGRNFPRPGPGAANPSIGAYEPQYAATATANAVWVENVYEVLLNRSADANGLATWTGLLASGTTRATVVADIEGSFEYVTDQVFDLYGHYLKRQPDQDGLTHWVNAILAGSTIEQVAAAFIGSDEYFVVQGASSNLGFLNALYEDTLKRLPDPFGLDSFMQALASGQSRMQVAALVLGSPEYQTNLIASTYERILGRPADPAGLLFFQQQLKNGATDQMLLAEILGSDEVFNNRT